jgi:hypothetical protein
MESPALSEHILHRLRKAGSEEPFNVPDRIRHPFKECLLHIKGNIYVVGEMNDYPVIGYFACLSLPGRLGRPPNKTDNKENPCGSPQCPSLHTATLLNNLAKYLSLAGKKDIITCISKFSTLCLSIL